MTSSDQISAFSVLIPARMASSRRPDKPLADIAGLPMVVRVARQVQLSGARRVVNYWMRVCALLWQMAVTLSFTVFKRVSFS